MSTVLEKISLNNSEAAAVLKQAGFHTDPDICSLTRQDLYELFPGAQNLRLRRDIFEIIHRQNRVNVLLQEVKVFILEEYFNPALTNNERVVENLQALKNIKTRMDDVHTFLDLHISVLDDRRKNSEPNEGESFVMVNQSDFEQATVKYRVVVSGKTFGAHEELLTQVKDHAPEGVKFTESVEDCEVIIIFCPISSRVGSDVDAAMTYIQDDKPVILVLMHHTREAKCTTRMRTWNNDAKIKLHVNVFYHETMKGLLRCPENDRAVSEIQKKINEVQWLKK